MSHSLPGWLAQVKFNESGLVAAIAQCAKTRQVLMLAWMNAQALQQTLETGHAVYWSRSRQALWHKGESSGHIQYIKEIRLDCDGDAILLLVEQVGGIACHTGRASCFYRQLQTKTNQEPTWVSTEAVLKDPSDIYSKP